MREYEEAMAAPLPQDLKSRFRRRFFGYKHCFAPDAPGHFKDALHTTVCCGFDWKDRFKILLSGKVVVKTVTVTENAVGDSVTSSLAFPVAEFN